jgi:hypothetical protein
MGKAQDEIVKELAREAGEQGSGKGQDHATGRLRTRWSSFLLLLSLALATK